MATCAPLAASSADAYVVSAFDKPNVLLALRAGAVVEAERFGYAFRPGQAMLALYVDEPARFIDAVGAAIAASFRDTPEPCRCTCTHRYSNRARCPPAMASRSG
ncbi:hypothetical protein ACFSQU_19255 [Massilia sp. GCM10020059]|uniref:Uncharacterized protein n=1 Tax=Massilia agrisoli TaxID=2892444 RepID=A0ABS8IWS5_9BURK|nr:hypothetical protein [Massilia agrisoli]MCC6071680.1 hypothetical protein [Massilia agrisoli]